MPPHKWTCDVCYSDFRNYAKIEINRSKVCPECLFTIFRKARDFEHDYPARWGNLVLQPREFDHLALLNEKFIDSFEAREKEYKTPPRKRVYCAHPLTLRNADGSVSRGPVCGTFIDVRKNQAGANVMPIGRCPGCSNLTCMVCTQAFAHAQFVCTHECQGFESIKEKDEAAFATLERGKAWQFCPNKRCHRRIELSEACNHMSCPCGSEFCFVCGKEVEEDEDHWERGGDGCPRYGHPDNGTGHYDDGESDFDDGEIEDAVDSDDESELPRLDGEDDDPLNNIADLFESHQPAVPLTVQQDEPLEAPQEEPQAQPQAQAHAEPQAEAQEERQEARQEARPENRIHGVDVVDTEQTPVRAPARFLDEVVAAVEAHQGAPRLLVETLLDEGAATAVGEPETAMAENNDPPRLAEESEGATPSAAEFFAEALEVRNRIREHRNTGQSQLERSESTSGAHITLEDLENDHIMWEAMRQSIVPEELYPRDFAE